MILVYITYRDNLPPRTPKKVARLISGLSVPIGSSVIEFQDQWNDFNGNGYSFISIQLSDKSFDELYNEAQDEGYRKLPITENIYGPLKAVSDTTKLGIYKVVIHDEESMSFDGAILSVDDKRLVVYFSVN